MCKTIERRLIRYMISSTIWCGLPNTERRCYTDILRNAPAISYGRYARHKDVEIIKGSVSRDRIHLFVSVPPHLSISKLMQSHKGKTSYKLLSEYQELSKQFWGCHIWWRGYLAASSGNMTDEVIMEYIATQNFPENDGDFNITS